jgi:hypothetical protein
MQEEEEWSWDGDELPHDDAYVRIIVNHLDKRSSFATPGAADMTWNADEVSTGLANLATVLRHYDAGVLSELPNKLKKDLQATILDVFEKLHLTTHTYLVEYEGDAEAVSGTSLEDALKQYLRLSDVAPLIGDTFQVSGPVKEEEDGSYGFMEDYESKRFCLKVLPED